VTRAEVPTAIGDIFPDYDFLMVPAAIEHNGSMEGSIGLRAALDTEITLLGNSTLHDMLDSLSSC
jgi:hypothetical protein